MDELLGQSEKALDPETWVERHGDYLFRYALSRLRDVDSAEEVVQETFVAGLRSLDQYARKGAEVAWLLGILKRKIVDHVRRRIRTGDDLDPADDLTEALFDSKGNWRADPRIFGARPEAALEREEFWKVFRNCLATLPERQADVFTLREMEGLNSENICKELELSASNLWVLLYRARMRLSHCIKAHWAD